MNDEQLVSDTAEEVEVTAELMPAELEKEWEKAVERAMEIHPVIKLGARTDLGRVRENNEDKFDFFEPDDAAVAARKGSLYAVADGMGGHAAGQIASEMALKTLIKAYYADPSPDVAGSLKRAIFDANRLIHDASTMIVERSGMGTTLTAVVVRADEAYFAQVGDSRAYLIRDGKIRQVTEDHSWVAEQVKRGALTEEEAVYSPFRNVITRSLGNAPSVEPDIFQETVQAGDVFVLCSDGLSGNLSRDDIKSIIAGKGPSRAALELVDAANERGGTDNITAVVVNITDIITGEEQKKEPTKKGFLGLFR
jgi:PPM family protein phosphatase